MKKILAVSGGVDSVVMLHLFRHDPDVIVAHFDHGIRPNSVDDCNFVKRLAAENGNDFHFARAQLGPNCSEATARAARYDFLQQLTRDLNGKIYTAHHLDDLAETVVINLLRGTGWRGLAALNNSNIERPLLTWSKREIYQYAAQHQLHFRLDQTNSDPKYLRNRVRVALQRADRAQVDRLAQLALRQRALATQIDAELADLPRDNYPRALATLDQVVALEILRAILQRQQISQTRPQLQRALAAIRDYTNGKQFPLNQHYALMMGRYCFRIVPTICPQ